MDEDTISSDELDSLNSSSDQTITSPELFAWDDYSCSSTSGTSCSSSDDNSSSDDEDDKFDNLDECIDKSYEAYSLGDFIRSQSNPNKRRRTNFVDEDLRPVAFVRLNTSLGKPELVTIKALMDSGASESLITEKYLKKLRMRKSQGPPVTWTTPAGEMQTQAKVKAQFTLPELQSKRLIEWRFHVTKDMGAYDMIIGRDILSFLGVDISFSNQVVTWDGAEMPFKPRQATPQTAFHIQEGMAISDATERIKTILDAKYEAADLEKVCTAQDQLNLGQQQKLLTLLNKYADLFDGTLGKWNHDPIELELKPDAQPYHARPYPIPRCHADTLKMEIDRLCQVGVLKRVNRSEWAAPSFIIPKKDGTVRFINDFRELNKRIRRRPYPIPNIQDMLLNLEGFQYATSLDLNMGYYHIELSPQSKQLCTLVFPFGKYEMQRLPMGLCNSPDIFQEKMSELMQDLDFVRTYIDDLLVLTKGSYEDHLEKLERVLVRLKNAGLKVNAKKSFFAREELEYLGYWITREGIKPLPDKVKAILKIDTPRNRKELRSFIGIVNYYRDMWIKRSHVLAPLAGLTSSKAKWQWGPQQQAAFDMAKRIIAKEVMLAYPDFNKPFVIHTDASHYQLGAVISQDGKPVAFYSRKLNPAQTRYTTTERELLSIVETLKEYRNILLGQQIEVFTDHKNLVYKTFNTERVMRWRLIIEEFGPKLTYIKGENNIVADALSRMRLSEKDFSAEAFAALMAVDDTPKEFPLSYKRLAREQAQDNILQGRLRNPKEKDHYKTKKFTHSDYSYDLVTRDGKIVIPKSMEQEVTEWYHEHLLHPGEKRLELTLRQHFTFIGLGPKVTKVCKACAVCRSLKAQRKKYGKLPPKEPETIPWHTLCIDLIGPYDFGKKESAVSLHCMTMIDPATGWFEIVEIPNKRADFIANILEQTWLTRYPWPTEIRMDRGKEFAGEVAAALKTQFGIQRKLITTQNPQANAIIERIHQVVGDMIRTRDIRGKNDLDPHFGWTGVLSAVRHAVRSLVHTTTRATPTQLVFGRDALLNVSFVADWQYIKERKQYRILQNNKRENKTRKEHTYKVGDQVMVEDDPNRKLEGARFKGPYTVSRLFDNGTVQLTKATNGGAVSQTWNIRLLKPC